MNYNILKSIILLSFIGSTFSYAEYTNYDDRYEAENNHYAQQQKSIPAKQVIIQNRKEITALKSRVSELEERVFGLTSLLEGANSEIAALKMGRNSIPSAMNEEPTTDNKALIKELGVMIDKINASYVSREELQQLLNDRALPNSKKIKKENAKTEKTVDSKPTAKVYSEGVRLFIKQRYDEAKKRFIITDSKGYKPAASNYYLGEIAYYTKKYQSAIFHYKKSAGIYDQASYIDVLLLHTAISLDKTGDKTQARSFYENIIANYPDKKSAKIAKEKLKKL
ncbi:TPR repeat containing exported protein; Putative periplasmic protein contains a protein prenylyltransferase domain [hydrothermal vent metagenome]|uniref:TPR repeat containing exported protein Putative periplasmic protein contains a protein prenylyltransferase domain n=1 Tax=hydrothermal vent metagenome TaxID=652676 RepID=A0A1W1ED56_9ZZZZ